MENKTLSEIKTGDAVFIVNVDYMGHGIEFPTHFPVVITDIEHRGSYVRFVFDDTYIPRKSYSINISLNRMSESSAGSLASANGMFIAINEKDAVDICKSIVENESKKLEDSLNHLKELKQKHNY